MLIVLEGCDGSGKSTLANLLAQVYNAEVIHATRETPNDLAWFSTIMDEAKNRNIIMDRAFWGQFVYQKPLERKLGFVDLGNLERRLVAEGGKLVYVYSPENIIKRRLRKRNEVTSLPVRSLLKKYKNMCIYARCPVVWYNSHTGLSKPFEHKERSKKNESI